MSTANGRGDSGFTLIEVMVAGSIMSIGLLALAYCYGQGMAVVMASQQDSIARQKAREAMEDVLDGRNTDTLTWSQINNVSNGGIFLDGAQALTTPGADGFVNTADDGPVETMTMPGPDGILGTSDDITVPLNGYTRTILITPINTNLKQVTVTITYTIPPGTQRSFQLVTYVSPYI